MTTALTPQNKRILYRSSTQSSQTYGVKSVAFLLDTPTNQSKAHLKSTKPTKEFPGSTLNRFSVFDKAVSCRILFDTTERVRGKRSKSNERNASIERDFLNISDSFQYRSQGLLEEDDLILNITSQKNMLKNLSELDQSSVPEKRGGKSKKSNMVMVKSKPRMRRKSDTSIWSGGESELERKIVFLTFEYISKPLDFQPGNSMLKGTETPSRDTPGRGTPSTKSLTSFKDGSPNGMISVTKKLFLQSKVSQNQTPKIVIMGTQDKKSEKLKGKDSPRAFWPEMITKESAIFGEKFQLDNEDNENPPKLGLGKEEEVLFQKYLTMSKDSITKSNDVSEVEISKDNTPLAKRSKSPIGGEQRFWNKRFTGVKDGSPKPTSPPKKDGPHIQLNYFQPMRTGRLNFTMSVKANSMLKDPINFGGIRDSVSIPKIYRRDLSTGSIQMKGTPTDNEVMYGFTTRLKLLQDAARDGSHTPQTNRMNKTGALVIRKHQTLMNKIHGHGRSTSSLSGVIEQPIVKEDKKSLPHTSRVEKRTIFSGMESPGQSRQLPRLESNYGSVKRRSGKNSQERSQNRSSMEVTRKAKSDFKTLINAEEMETNFIKSLRAEKAIVSRGKLGKFKPKITGNKQVLKNYGLVK